MNTSHKLRYLSLINFIFALFIILWGAYVRLSGSGAGCGDHWPLCNGQVIPLEQSFKTFIEFTHRLTSGVFGITVFIQWVLTFKWCEKGPIRQASTAVLILTLFEALIGAVLVKKGLVVDNSSLLRAVVIGFHLVNTFFLMAALVASYYFASDKQITKSQFLIESKLKLLLILTLFIFVGASGAVTALGNTLFPESSLIEGIYKDFSSSSHFLIQLRILHPISAILLGLLLIGFALKSESNKQTSKRLLITVVISLLFGFINWLLLAPTWGALVHLALANMTWALFILSILEQSWQKSIR